MFLMFDLHRPDVLPTNDVGINRAIMRQYGLEAMPKPPEVLAIGGPWRPGPRSPAGTSGAART
jgi:DNA-3-methyladenine glycosylase II